MMPVSVIVLNWNGRHLLGDCLASLRQQSFRDFEVILVDNGSTDGSRDYIASEFPEVKLVCLPQNRGFCGGNNIGISVARSEYVTLLNNDTEVAPDWLEKLYTHICADNRIAACDSKVLYSNQRHTIWSAGGEYSIAGAVYARGGLMDDSEIQEPSDIFTAVACAAIYRKDVLDEIGLFDEDYFAGYEDVDWSFRAHLRGYRIVNVPTSRVYHKVSATHRHNSKDFVYRGQRNVTATFIKNMPSELLWRYLPLHLLYVIGSLTYFTRIGRASSCLWAKWDLARDVSGLWRKRQKIQRLRTLSGAEIDALLSRDWLGPKARKFIR